jgi:hypothetical protein
MANTLNTVSSGGIEDGSIVNADINASAAIALSKLASTPAVLTGSTNNTICTVTGANAITGETKLTFDSTTLEIDGGTSLTNFSGDTNRGSANQSLVNFQGKWNGTTVARILLIAGSDTTNKDDGQIRFDTATSGSSITERMRIDSSGNLRLNNADSLIHTSADTSRLRLFGGSAASVSNGAALTLHGVNHSSGNYADLAAATGGTIQFRVGTSEKLRIQAGGGISFNGDTAAANALDDYEEGTWTPGLKFGSASTGMTYNWSPAGVYTKIGRQVTVKFGWDWSSKGSATGALQVTGLPFTSTHTAYNHFTGSVITFNGPNADGSMTSYLSSTNINFRLHNEANLNVSPTQADFDDDTKVMGTVTYFV